MNYKTEQIHIWRLMVSHCSSLFLRNLDDCNYFGPINGDSPYYYIAPIYFTSPVRSVGPFSTVEQFINKLKPQYRPIAEAMLLEYQMANI